jgi:hypothetical protein
MGVAKRLQLLQPDDHVGLPGHDERRIHHRAKAHMTFHTAAALRHAMHFGLFHVEARAHRRLRRQFGDEQYTLAADSSEDKVRYAHTTLSS